jgi:hypothetical protein
MAQYEKLWKKKTKGVYLCGLGRWCKVAKHNIDKDPENGTKLFQIIMMIIFGLASVGLTFLIDYESYHEIGLKKYWMHALGFGIEIIIGFTMSFIGYAMLAKQWEGYFNHRFMQFIHYFTILVVSTIFPHGDFLLHMGYMHKGTNKRGKEEPFPDGFEIPKEQAAYQVYLNTQTRGGHFYFLTFGYIKCVLIFIRMTLILLFYFLEGTGTFRNYFKYSSLILMCLICYTLFNLLMAVKFLMENNSCHVSCNVFSRCCQRTGDKKAHESDEEDDEVII